MLYTFVYVPMKQKEMQSCRMGSSQRSSFQATPEMSFDGITKHIQDVSSQTIYYIKYFAKNPDKLGDFIDSWRNKN